MYETTVSNTVTKASEASLVGASSSKPIEKMSNILIWADY